MLDVPSMEGLGPSILTARRCSRTKHLSQVRQTGLIERADTLCCLGISLSSCGLEAAGKLESACVLAAWNHTKATNVLGERGGTGNDGVCILMGLGVEVDEPLDQFSAACCSADIDNSTTDAA